MTEEDRYEYAMNQSMQSLASDSFNKWGDPIENRKRLVPYGYDLIDKAVYGIDLLRGEFDVLQGEEKGRKSTTLYNIVRSIMQRQQLEKKPVVVIDSLESSSSPEIVKDNFICQVAAQYIMHQGHTSDNGICSKCGGKRCQELTLSVRSLPFTSKTPLQHRALQFAIDHVSTWSVYVFGAGMQEGQTRNLEGTTRRWKWLKENFGATLFASDHVQQYNIANQRSGLSDYEKQQIVVPHLSTFVAEEKVVVLALSQLSLGTRRDSDGRQYAIGGAKMAAEANTVIQSRYDEDMPSILGVQVVESRYSGKLTAYGFIDPASGLTYGDMSYDIPRIGEKTIPDNDEEFPY